MNIKTFNMAYEKKGASKIVKNERAKKEQEKFNKNHNNDFEGKKVEEIKHHGNHGKDTFGV